MKRLKSLLPRLCRKKLQQAVGAKLAVGAKQIPITKAMLQTARRVYQRVHTGYKPFLRFMPEAIMKRLPNTVQTKQFKK